MKKASIAIVITLMTIALVGLTSFQVYWINNALKLNQERFKTNVHRTLINISDKIMKQEMLKSTAQSISMNTPESITSVSVKKEDGKTFFFLRSKDEAKQTISIDNFQDTTSHVYRFSQIRTNFDSTTTLRKSIKQDMIHVMMTELFEKPVDIRDRLNFDQIDTLLSKGLHDHGIDIDYQFAILADKDDVVFTNAEDNLNQLKSSSFKASLFPSDVLENVNYLAVNFPDKNQFLFRQIGATLATSLIFILIIVGCFSYAIFVILKQKKLSEIKNDFINNMTHEFKTPLATVGLACEAISEPEIIGEKDTVLRYVGVIQDESKRLGEQVEKVLQTALLDKNSFKLNLEIKSLHPLISNTIEKLRVRANAQQGTLSVNLGASNDLIALDTHHISNVLYNLVDNALKYTLEPPKIHINTQNDGNMLHLIIKDNGIGMSKEQLKKIFTRFYRVPTGNRHDVKGFGLGLSYVKKIVEMHGGEISADSRLKNGSTFTITLPLNESAL